MKVTIHVVDVKRPVANQSTLQGSIPVHQLIVAIKVTIVGVKRPVANQSTLQGSPPSGRAIFQDFSWSKLLSRGKRKVVICPPLKHTNTYFSPTVLLI